MRNRVLIIGAGGHAKVVAEIVQQQGHTLLGFLDDDERLIGESVLGIPVLGSISSWKNLDFDGILIGIGDNHVRYKIKQELSAIEDLCWIEARHPSSIVSPTVLLGTGTTIVAGAVINVHAKVGSHCIINTGATIDHDCEIGDYSHMGPGVNLAGGVSIGEGVFIGTGATVIPGCKIGDWTIVGAGATVISDIPAHITVVGTPAKPMRKR
ncbi:transferase [bacterium]|nr:transferase [bacterium]